ncbi:MAG: AAA family ATPase [Gemmataceae bacterium]
MNPVDVYNFIKEAVLWDGVSWAAFGTGSMVALLAVWAVRRLLPSRSEHGFNGWLRKDIQELKKERAELHRARTETSHQLTDQRVALTRLQKDLESCQAENAMARNELSTYTRAFHNLKTVYKRTIQQHAAVKGQLSEACEELKHQLADADAARHQTEATVKSLRAQLQAVTADIDAVARADGRLWEKPPVERPSPRLPGGRRAPIVAVLNLKGGVGKTTLTANLGATLGKQGRKVLLVDLDYQASLSSLCLTGEMFRQVRDHGHFVQHLFHGNRDGDDLKQLLTPLNPARGQLLATDEDLQDVEAQLQGRWLVRPGDGDVRFLLRQTLHAPAVQEAFDFVFLDCPPRLTTACVNALACCDYALIPVLLDETSAAAVPRLLRWLDRLRPAVCPDLEVLGVVANRVTLRNGNLIKGQQAVWNELPVRCQDVWREPVYFFRTHVKQDSAFADAADRHRFAADDPDVQPFFRDLADELRERVNRHESGRAAAVPPKPERTAEHVGCH